MRKTILTVAAATLVAAGASLTGSIAPAAAQMVDGPEVSWKMSLWGKRRAFTEGAEYVSAQVAERTGGKFTIKLFYGQQLSKSKENLDGISLGAFEAAIFCASYHPGKNAPLNVLDLPFLPLANFGVMRKVHDAVYGHPSAQEALGKWNAVIYMSNILPQYEYMGRGEPPQSVADFEGQAPARAGRNGPGREDDRGHPVHDAGVGDVYRPPARHGGRDRLPRTPTPSPPTSSTRSRTG